MSSAGKETSVVAATGTDTHSASEPHSDHVPPVNYGAPEILDTTDSTAARDNAPLRRSKRDRFRYLMTKDFWVVMLLGQILALCLTGTNTLTTLLVIEGTSIPAFQTFFNYVLLNIIYTSFTIYKYGLKGWARLLWKDGWKCKLPSTKRTP